MIHKAPTQYSIIVSGKVQGVSFRDRVEDLAMEYDITGYVQNSPKKEVYILAQGRKENLDSFCDKIQRCEPLVKVHSIRITEQPCETVYSEFLILRGDPNEELTERLDAAVYFLYSMDRKQDLMLYKQDQALGNQDQMLKKKDQMIGKQDQMLGKQDQMIDLQRESISIQSTTLDEVRALRTDLTDRIMTEITLARSENKELRNELIQAGIKGKAGS